MSSEDGLMLARDSGTFAVRPAAHSPRDDQPETPPSSIKAAAHDAVSTHAILVVCRHAKEDVQGDAPPSFPKKSALAVATECGACTAWLTAVAW